MARLALLRARIELTRRIMQKQCKEMRKGTPVSRGPGRCQRAILELLERTPSGELTRRQVEEALTKKGFTHSNILRSTRGLVKKRMVELQDSHNLDTSIVRLPPPPVPVDDDKVSELLAQLSS